MLKPIPDRLSLNLFPPVTDPLVHRYLENARDNPFRARATGVDLLNAWWLAEISLLVYSEPVVVETELRRAGLVPVGPPLNGPSTQAFAALGDGFAVIAFRGTQVFVAGRDRLEILQAVAEDDLADVRIPLVSPAPPSRGRVHRGFRNALDEIWDPLNKLVARLRHDDPGRAIWLTGHSLGGALALLAAARLPEVHGVYVFGAPHVGDADFRAALRARPVRFVHGSDLVTRVPLVAPYLPPRISFDGLIPDLEPVGFYRPVGDVVAFDRHGRRVPPTDPDGLMAALGAELRHLQISPLDWALRQPLDDLIDHAPVFYAVHLWNLYQQSLGPRVHQAPA